MYRKKFFNKSILALLILLGVSLSATFYLSINNKKNIETFSNRGVDTIAWPFFQVERTYFEIEKLLIKNENNLSEIDLDEFSNYFDVYYSTFKNLEGVSYQPLIQFNCLSCSEKPLLEQMKSVYYDLEKELNSLEILSRDGWKKEEFKIFLKKHEKLTKLNGDLVTLANQKSAFLNSSKQEEILGIANIMISLFIFQVFCFVIFSSFSLYQIYRLIISQGKLQESYDTISKSREEILTAYQSKTQLLARLSHEIRTPLNSILGFAQVMEKDKENGLNEEQMSNLKPILKSSNLVINLINQILDFSRLETGKIELNYQNFNLSDPIDEVNSLLQNDLKANNVTLKYEFDNYFVYADQMKTKQIIINLITNALKYGNQNSEIIFSQKEEGKFIVFSVKNYGTTITKEKQPFLFTEFYRADYSDSAIHGHGIGLSICKKLSEIMGGSISFSSENNETIFNITLPKGEVITTSMLEAEISEIDNKSNYVSDVNFYLVIISEQQRYIDSMINIVNRYSNVKHIVVPDVEFAKDIIEYSNVKHVLYTDSITSEFRNFLTENNIEFLRYDLDGTEEESIKENDLDSLFKRWFL